MKIQERNADGWHLLTPSTASLLLLIFSLFSWSFDIKEKRKPLTGGGRWVVGGGWRVVGGGRVALLRSTSPISIQCNVIIFIILTNF